MPRTALAVTTLAGNPAGIPPTAEVAIDNVNGTVVPGIHDQLWVEATCTVAGPVNITFVTPVTVGTRAVPDDVNALSGIGTKRRYGPFDKKVYGNDLQIDG